MSDQDGNADEDDIVEQALDAANLASYLGDQELADDVMELLDTLEGEKGQ